MNLGSLQAKIIAAFNAAADTYDAATPVQRRVAFALIANAAEAVLPPSTILDLGSGAGHVTELALRQWPGASITALDAAPAMLAQLHSKIPNVLTIERDASCLDGLGRYELILSSMMLHWLDDPRAALADWRAHLAPGGQLHVAVPVEGSLNEWRELAKAAGFEDGLWNFPTDNFARGLADDIVIEDFSVDYPDVRAFLKALKCSGAHKSRPGVQPAAAGRLRRLLFTEIRPFKANFRVAFLSLRHH